MKFKEVWQTGSHQQYHHANKKGTVTIAGKPNEDVHPKTLKSIFKQAQILNNNSWKKNFW